jgi:hypothetical protein
MNDLGMLTFFPQCNGQPPLKDFGMEGSRSIAFDRLDDIFEFPEILLPHTTAFAVRPAPFGVVIVGLPMDLFGLKPFHAHLLVIIPEILGHSKRPVKPYLILFYLNLFLGDRLNSA